MDKDITAICKQYRKRVIERGEFVSWQEKIAKKPMVRNLFGALMAFIGYNKTTDIDYIASAKTLKSYGFDTVFFYPARMCSYSLNFKMGGDDPIWFSDDELKKMREMDRLLRCRIRAVPTEERMRKSRKQYSGELKAKIALEAIKGQRTLSEIAGAYDVHPSQVTQWKKQALEQLPEVFSERRVRIEKADEELKAQLYQQIGQLKVELDWLKKKSGLGS